GTWPRGTWLGSPWPGDCHPDVARGDALVGNAAEEDAAVVAAEAHRVRERNLDLCLARLVRHVVEVARRVGVLVVDRRRELPVPQREDAHHRLDRARGRTAEAHVGLRRVNVPSYCVSG